MPLLFTDEFDHYPAPPQHTKRPACTWAVVKRNTRLMIVDRSTQAVVYCPPNFLRPSRRALTEFMADLWASNHDIAVIAAFEGKHNDGSAREAAV